MSDGFDTRSLAPRGTEEGEGLRPARAWKGEGSRHRGETRAPSRAARPLTFPLLRSGPPPLPRGEGRDSGFTLLELLVVLAIMGLLAAIVAPQVLKYLGSSRTQTAKVQIQNVSAALELYKLDVGRYPTPDEGLAALVTAPASAPGWNGPYIQKASALRDPWAQPYLYRIPGQHGEVDVYTLGSDKAEGGTGEARDVGDW